VRSEVFASGREKEGAIHNTSPVCPRRAPGLPPACPRPAQPSHTIAARQNILCTLERNNGVRANPSAFITSGANLSAATVAERGVAWRHGVWLGGTGCGVVTRGVAWRDGVWRGGTGGCHARLTTRCRAVQRPCRFDMTSAPPKWRKVNSAEIQPRFSLHGNLEQLTLPAARE
jgi:hypothetical protein